MKKENIKTEQIEITKHSLVLSKNVDELLSFIKSVNSKDELEIGLVISKKGKVERYWVETKNTYFFSLKLGDIIFYLDDNANFRDEGGVVMKKGWYVIYKGEGTKDIIRKVGNGSE